MTGTTSDPVVKIYDPNDQTRFWDISTIISNINIAYGRNQPFSVAEVVVKKLYFNSIQNYWDEVDTTPTDQQGNKELPSRYLEDGKSPIIIEAYGSSFDMFIERHESKDNDDYITFLCYNKAYKLKNAITLNSLSQITLYTDNKLYFTYDTQHQNPLTGALVPATVFNNNPVLATYTLSGTDNVQFSVKVAVAETQPGAYVFTYGPQNVEFIQGTGSNIFRFVAMKGAGYNYNECICDNGFTYDYGAGVQKTYTRSQIQQIKNSQVIEDTQQETIIKLRVNEDSRMCWDILKSVGALSNRWPFFYDCAYFADYNTASQTTSNHIQKIYKMNLDYGTNEQSEILSYTQQAVDSDKKQLDIYEIVANADQGSTYVQTSQKVFAEGYSTKVSISDIADNNAGYDLYFPYPEQDPTVVSVIDNSQRNKLQKEIAFNRVVANYKPMDAVQFKISEISGQEDQIDVEDRIYASPDELPQTAIEGDYALVIQETILLTYYKYTQGQWAVDETAFTMNDRVQRFNPYCIIETITDVQNGITINNAPLAYVELMWPSCLTQVTFGNPEFMDAQQQWSFLSLEAQVSTQEGTEDSLISDRYASKLVIGNQTMQNLVDDRSGFTGLIMEKNWDNELYRLSGYDNGTLQAYFNSKGEIVSGDGESGDPSVVINHDGIIISGNSYIDPTILPDGGIPEWDDEVSYSVGDVVQYNYTLYVCQVQNTGVQPGQQNQSGVQPWQASGNLSNWSVTGFYKVGDMVSYNGALYKCIRDTGNTHTVPGITSPSTTYWSRQDTVNTTNLNGDIDATSNNVIGGSIDQWVTGKAYAVGNIVVYETNGKVYSCKRQHTSSNSILPTNTTYWNVVNPSSSRQSRTTIDSYGLTTYNSSGNMVCRVGTDGNIYGVKVLATDIQAGTLNAGVIYGGTIEANKITVNNGKITASQIDAQNLSIGGSAQYADSQGSALVNQWSSGEYYVTGDTVTYTNSTDTNGLTLYFRCKSDHTQTSARRPKGGSSSSTFWDEISQANSQQTTTPHVVIDSAGLRTYQSGSTTPSCEVNSLGHIVAGGGYVTLSENGLTIQSKTLATSTNTGIMIYKDTDGNSLQTMSVQSVDMGGASGGMYTDEPLSINSTMLKIDSTSVHQGVSLRAQQKSYSQSTYYNVGDSVYYGGSTYVCTVAGSGHTPSSSSSYWKNLNTKDNYSELQLTPWGIVYHSPLLGKTHRDGLIAYSHIIHNTGYTYVYHVLGYGDGVYKVYGYYGLSTGSGTTGISLELFRAQLGVYAINVHYASCTTIRNDSGASGYNYVSADENNPRVPGISTQASPVTLYFTHESGAGFFFEIWGQYAVNSGQM